MNILFASWRVQLRNWLFAHPNVTLGGMAAAWMLGGSAAFAVATWGPDVSLLPVNQVVQPATSLALEEQLQALSTQTLNLYRTEVSRSTDSADSLLQRLGVTDAQAAAFMRQNPLVRQQLLGRSGRTVSAVTDAGQRLNQLTARWPDDKNITYQQLTMVRAADGQWSSALSQAPLQLASRMASGTIQTSLFAATDEVRLPDSVASQLADIFSGDIDFHRALRKGDRFSVVYETLEADGEQLRSGKVLSAQFVNNGKTHHAVWFQAPLQDKGGYYTLEGQSLRRAYLASPLAFSRVTSGFSMRFHPILQTWRAHLGVDYAAPSGTPVRVVGDGTVAFAGQQGGYGNVVMVTHSNGHKTLYAHLSALHVRNGQSVSQGQSIGAVGATGWATGPHLHFEFRVNDKHQDPLTLARQSESVPVAAAYMQQFRNTAQLAVQNISAAASLSHASAQ